MTTPAFPISNLNKELLDAFAATESSQEAIYLVEGDVKKAVLMHYKQYQKLTKDETESRKTLSTNELLSDAYVQLLLSTAGAMDNHQSYLHGHNERVAIFSCEIARQLGCTDMEVNHIHMASLMHDIGEIIIPSYILQKQNSLSEEDWDIIKDHPKIGADFIAKIEHLKPVAEIVLAHHEKYDGSGYPYGLKNEEIPLGSRILSVADTYDAMTNLRLHRESSNHEEAVNEIKRLSGIYYDPEAVKVFLKLF